MKRGTLLLALLGILVLMLATGPDLWAAPGQSPERQTVPTRTPKPEPTDKPDEPAEPTDEPPSSEPTPVPTTVPSAVATMVAGADGVNVRSGPGTNYTWTSGAKRRQDWGRSRAAAWCHYRSRCINRSRRSGCPRRARW